MVFKDRLVKAVRRTKITLAELSTIADGGNRGRKYRTFFWSNCNNHSSHYDLNVFLLH